MSKSEPPPPPPGYGQPPPPPAYGNAPGTTVVMTQQPMFVSPTMFRDCSIPYTCHFCHAQITTSIHFETGGVTWIACVFLAVIGCWMGCCLIPFCVDACKDCVHTCPNCKQVVGRFTRM